jgi:hypothetical protein
VTDLDNRNAAAFAEPADTIDAKLLLALDADAKDFGIEVNGHGSPKLRLDIRVDNRPDLLLIKGTEGRQGGREEGMEGGMVTPAPVLVRFSGIQKTYDGEHLVVKNSTSTSGRASSSPCLARQARARRPR